MHHCTATSTIQSNMYSPLLHASQCFLQIGPDLHEFQDTNIVTVMFELPDFEGIAIDVHLSRLMVPGESAVLDSFVR